MDNIIKRIKNEFKNCNDLIHKEIKINNTTYDIFYLESVSSSDKVSNYILNGFSFNNSINNIKKSLPSPNIIKVDINNISYYLCSGFTIILDNMSIYAIETRANIDRSITESSIEANLYGPKDSFVENIQINLGLVKRRIKSNQLKNITLIVGKFSKTTTNILYIDNIVKKDLLNNIINKIKNIDIDSILDSSSLKNILDNSTNPFPTIKVSDRPDTICASLLNGKVIILIDNSPFALIIPTFLLEFINPISDDYSKTINSSFLKILRIIAFIFSIFIPAYYIAITTYNQETIPLPLLLNFSNQRSAVPFPAIIEAIIMIIICELLKESDLRFPNNYGSQISILGALVIGEAAVHAGIVSPIMIIIIAITFISSLIFTDNEISGAIRFWRFIMLFFSSLFGLFGISIATIIFIVNITSYKSNYINYTFPLEPFDNSYLKKIVLGVKSFKRRNILTNHINRKK